MSEEWGGSAPDEPLELPTIPPGAFSDLVRIADSWVKSVQDKIEYLKGEHDDLRKELGAHSLLAQIREELGDLKRSHATFLNAMETFRAIEQARTAELVAAAVEKLLNDRRVEWRVRP